MKACHLFPAHDSMCGYPFCIYISKYLIVQLNSGRAAFCSENNAYKYIFFNENISVAYILLLENMAKLLM